MHELSNQELYQALHYAKSLDQEAGQRILIQFQIDQPQFFQTLFNTFAEIISAQDVELSHLYMDLCFDVVCIYQKNFGSIPKFKDDPVWMERQVESLTKLIKPFANNKNLSEKQIHRLKDDFWQPEAGELAQTVLVSFLHTAIDEHAKAHKSDTAAVELTKAMAFMTVKLFTALYASKPASVH